jgi:hypothetical protein
MSPNKNKNQLSSFAGTIINANQAERLAVEKFEKSEAFKIN